MTQPLRIGIIGAGWPGQQHARAAQATGAVVRTLAEPNEKRAAEFRATFSPVKIYPDYSDLLRDPASDAVVICLPNFSIFPQHLLHLKPVNTFYVKNRRR